MFTRQANTISKDRRGAVMVELALTVPLAFLLAVGVTDFGRLFYHAITARNASSIAALYGAQDEFKTGATAELRARALSETTNLGGDVTATPKAYCACPGADPFPCSDYATTTCTGYGNARVYVEVGVSQPFQTLTNYIKIPQTIQIGETTFMRVR